MYIHYQISNSMSIVRERVCASCHSLSIIDTNCICVWEHNYPTIELEFEMCDHCGHVSEEPADTEFNREQLGEQPEEEND